MILADFLPATPGSSWRLARQMGVNHAILKASCELTGLRPPWELDALRTIQKRFDDEGIKVVGLEGDQFNMQRIKLGLPGRDEDLERYCQMLRNMGELGIPLLCYNFMATIGWHRTDTAVITRGGALTTRFDFNDLPREEVPKDEQVTEEQLWKNYDYFLRAVLPDAERSGVRLGLHPDDPPLSPIRGVGRIFTSPESFDRAMALAESPSHGITFCQANFVAMGCDLNAAIPNFAPRIHFVHFRDIRGNAKSFEETFHDDGPTEMGHALSLYRQSGVNVPIRVDHVPTMAGEDNSHHGYAMLGRLFAIGYMKGIMDALQIRYI